VDARFSRHLDVGASRCSTEHDVNAPGQSSLDGAGSLQLFENAPLARVQLDRSGLSTHGRTLIPSIVSRSSSMSAKERRAIAEQLVAIPPIEERLALAAGRHIGEGFDDARLDRLFLAMPVSWKGPRRRWP
jgi:hypothetical protein